MIFVQVFLPLWLIIGVACGVWAGRIGARYVGPEDRRDVIVGGVIVGLLIGIFAVPLFYFIGPKGVRNE